MPVRSDKLFVGTVTPTSPAGGVLFTVPTERTVIIKYVTAYARGSTSALLRFLVRSGGANHGIRRYDVAPGPFFFDWHLWLVLDAGDQLLCDSTADLGWWVTVSGTSLLGPTQ